MPKKVVVRINDDAWVEEKGKRLTGEKTFDEKEAQRLVDLKVAVLVKAVDEKPFPDGEPKSSWKRDQIVAYLYENKIGFDDKANKDVLLKTFEESKKKSDSK